MTNISGLLMGAVYVVGACSFAADAGFAEQAGQLGCHEAARHSWLHDAHLCFQVQQGKQPQHIFKSNALRDIISDGKSL